MKDSDKSLNDFRNNPDLKEDELDKALNSLQPKRVPLSSYFKLEM